MTQPDLALRAGFDLAPRAPFDLTLGHVSAAMWELDVRSGVLLWEAQAAQVLDVGGELPTTLAALAALVHPDDAEGIRESIVDSLRNAGTAEASLRLGDGATLRHLSLRGKVIECDRRGRPARAVGLLVDVSPERAMEEQMLRMMLSDALTGAPNRRAFDRALKLAARRAARSGRPYSVLMIDIDDFKQLNDAFGHLVGDEVLCAVYRALQSAVPEAAGTLARFGGEEFAFVLPDTDQAAASAVALRMVTAVRRTAVQQAPGWTLGVSVGTATWTPDTPPLRADALLARADEALYEAKARGKNTCVAYEDALAARAVLQAAMADGLERGEFQLYYQPFVDVADERVVGYEALLRWHRPGHGVVGPDAFIPVAEATPLICDFGRWALHRAAEQIAQWLRTDARHSQWRVAVNIAARHVGDPRIITDVRDALAAAGVPPQRLEVEVTESGLLDTARACEHLAALRALGVTVSIDDFGTGYTSVRQLSELPVDVVKIDRSFVGTDDPRQRTLLTLMIGAAHALGLPVVAEGVEDTDTLQVLRELSCDQFQGYLVARPLPAAQVSAPQGPPPARSGADGEA